MRSRRHRRAVSQGGILEGGWFWGEGTTGDYEQCSLVNTVAGSWLLHGWCRVGKKHNTFDRPIQAFYAGRTKHERIRASFVCVSVLSLPDGGTVFIVRLVVALFSSKVSEQMRRHPVIHAIWGCFAFGGGLIVLSLLNPEMWPPVSVERREQRAKVMERVQAAGGWDAIRRDCVRFAEQNTNGFHSLGFRDTNGLPAALVALKPMEVEYQPQFGCVCIRIFGMHSTGGHSRPYFGLEVDTSTNSVSCNHGAGYGNGGVIGNRHTVAEQVAEGIYELY